MEEDNIQWKDAKSSAERNRFLQDAKNDDDDEQEYHTDEEYDCPEETSPADTKRKLEQIINENQGTHVAQHFDQNTESKVASKKANQPFLIHKDINLRLERRITSIADPNQHKPKQVFASESHLQRFDTWLDKSLVALSPTADLVLFAGHLPQPLVFLSKLKRDSINEYATKKLNVPVDFDEQITCILLLPIMSTKRTSIGSIDWTVLVFGFSTGYVKFYTEQSTCLLSLKFCDEPVVSLKCQTQKQNLDAQSESHFAIFTDEVLVAYKTSILVLDGICLHENLKLSKSETINQIPDYEPAYTLSNLPMTLNCKRWKLESFHGSNIVDAEILGTRQTSAFNSLLSASLNDEHVPAKTYASSIAFVGQNPFLTSYKETIESTSHSYTELIGSLLSIWNKPPPSKAQIVEQKPSISLFYDQDRRATSVVASPDKRLMAVTDDFGRVMMIDTTNWVVIRMWKGYRSAQCGWIQVRRNPEKRESPCATFLVIYAPKRGLVEIWSCQRGPRVAAFNVGKSCRLLYNGYKMINMRAEHNQRDSYIPIMEQCYHNHCYLLDPKSEKIFAVEVPYTYSLYKFGDLKYRDLLILRELATAIGHDGETAQLSEIVHRLTLAESLQSAVERLSDEMLPEKIVPVLENLINKIMMNYDNNSGETMSNDDKSIIELCKRVITLCNIFTGLSQQNSCDYQLPDVNRRLIEEYEEHPDELDRFSGLLGWPATEILRYLSLLSLDRSYRSTHESNPWPNLGEPLAWSEFVSCFDLNTKQVKYKSKEFRSFDTISIKFNNKIKSLNEDKVVKTALFMYNRVSESYYKNSSLSSNVQTFTSNLYNSYNFIEPSARLTLLFQFWLATKLCNHWRMWPFLQHQVSAISEELKMSVLEHEDESPLIQCWKQIYSLIVNSDNLFAAIISTTVIKADTMKTIQVNNKGENMNTKGNEDHKVVKTSDDCQSEEQNKVIDWECLCIDAERMSLLGQQLESLFLLNSLLKFSPSQDSIIDNHLYKVSRISVSNIMQKGPTIISELVAQWALQSNIALSTLIQSYGKQCQAEVEEKSEPIKEGRQIVGYKAPYQILNSDASDEEHIKELLHYTRNLFPFSLDPDILLINYYWECCQSWAKNPVAAADKSSLDKSYDCLVLISNIDLKYRLACLGWKTFFQRPLERLLELAKTNPLVAGNYSQTPKAARNRDNLLRKELNMTDECIKGFVQFCGDIIGLIMQLHGELNEKKVDYDDEDSFNEALEVLTEKLLTFDDWWLTPITCKTSPAKSDHRRSSSFEIEKLGIFDHHFNSSETSNCLNKILLSQASVLDLNDVVEFSRLCKQVKSILRFGAED